MAVTAGNKPVAELLLRLELDVNAKGGGTGATPLHWAAWQDYRELAEILLAAGADTNATDAQGLTPSDVAKRRGHREMAELLKKHGAKE